MSNDVSVLAEMNGYHYLSEAHRNAGFGSGVPLNEEGFDYTSLGADDVEGDTVGDGRTRLPVVRDDGRQHGFRLREDDHGTATTP